ncbi:MAG: hypothetical protein K0R25_145 [Rickettsiaceae bacterium]|jgi:hypothetical protein|nr:hypothetical protein [Rickettsiaceae bacterium]
MKTLENKQSQFLITILDPDYPYSKQVGNILAHSKNDQGQPFFSEELRAKADKLTNEEADELLPEIIDLIYKENPDQKPKGMINHGSGNGTRGEFFNKIYDDLASGNYPAQIDQNQIKTIEQFTPEGLDTAVEYYNQKYPDRPEIHRVQLLVNGLSDRPKFIETACESLLPLKQKNGHKILLTLARQNPKALSGISLDHSIPFVITDDKLVLMRDEHDSFGQQLFEDIAKGLEVSLVQSSAPIYDKEDPKRTSIQGDHASCHFIALGVLKDLTKEDLQTVSAFDNGFNPLPKSLKYSQSTTHIRNVLDEKSAQEPVKKDGRTAEQYAKQHKGLTEDGVITRINDKFNRFKKDLSEVVEKVEGRATPQIVAAEILDKRELEREEKKETFVEKLGLLEKEKSGSFVEAIQAGKYGKLKSSSGAHEL